MKAKQATYFSLMKKKGRNKIQKILLKKYDEHDSVQDKQMFLKKCNSMIWNGLVCYAILCYGMVWNAMLWDMSKRSFLYKRVSFILHVQSLIYMFFFIQKHTSKNITR